MRAHQTFRVVYLLFALVLLSACATPVVVLPTEAPTSAPTPTATLSPTPKPTETLVFSTPTEAPTLVPTPSYEKLIEGKGGFWGNNSVSDGFVANDIYPVFTGQTRITEVALGGEIISVQSLVTVLPDANGVARELLVPVSFTRPDGIVTQKYLADGRNLKLYGSVDDFVKALKPGQQIRVGYYRKMASLPSWCVHNVNACKDTYDLYRLEDAGKVMGLENNKKFVWDNGFLLPTAVKVDMDLQLH